MECYRNIVPGSRVLVWYADDDVWHEILVGLIVGNSEVIIYTPDDDLYREDISCAGASGPVKLRGLGRDFKVAGKILKPVYRFRQPITDEILKKAIRDSMKLAEDDGIAVGLPPKVLNAAGTLVDLDVLFGGPFMRDDALPIDDGAAAAPAEVEPQKPKNAVFVTAAPADSVWVAAEPLGGLILGQEVSLNHDSDVQVGDRTALAQRGNTWVKVELIPVREAADYAQKRVHLFVSSQPAKSPADRAGSSQDVQIATGDDPEAPHGDVRALWVDFDTHGERYKTWKDVCSESFTPVLDSKPFEGPCTTLQLLKHTETQGGDPRLWRQLWSRAKHIEPTDRTFHEMKMLTEVLYLAGTYDQVNIPGLMSLEVVCRRVQAIVDAYMNPSKPSWENAKLFTGQASPEDIVSPVFRTYAVKRNKEELELLQARQKVRELRGAPAVSAEEAALPKKPPYRAKNKKGGGGQGDA